MRKHGSQSKNCFFMHQIIALLSRLSCTFCFSRSFGFLILSLSLFLFLSSERNEIKKFLSMRTVQLQQTSGNAWFQFCTTSRFLISAVSHVSTVRILTVERSFTSAFWIACVEHSTLSHCKYTIVGLVQHIIIYFSNRIDSRGSKHDWKSVHFRHVSDMVAESVCPCANLHKVDLVSSIARCI